MELKQYKPLPIPSDTKWDRKVYNPIRLLDIWLYNNFRYSWVQRNMDKYVFIPLNQFKVGIQNLIKWFHVIWNDRDWDSWYTYEVLKKKLEFQRKYLVENNRVLSVPNDNFYITICLNLIERLQEDYYESEYQDYVEEDLWFGKEDEKGWVEVDVKVQKENLQDYFDKYPLITEKVFVKHPNSSKMSLALGIAMENHQRCKKLLFKILNEKIEGWWD